jgi:uncharacterized membrane protein YfcA
MQIFGSVVLALALAGAASACPVCVSEGGEALRARLRDHVWRDLAATLAPAPVLLALVGAVRLAATRLVEGRAADGAARVDER